MNTFSILSIANLVKIQTYCIIIKKKKISVDYSADLSDIFSCKVNRVPSLLVLLNGYTEYVPYEY